MEQAQDALTKAIRGLYLPDLFPKRAQKRRFKSKFLKTSVAYQQVFLNELLLLGLELVAEKVVEPLDGLLVEFAVKQNAIAIVRGLRAVSDFEFEFQMALMNRKLEANVETIFLMPKEEYTYLSSRIVREIARLGGDITSFVPPLVVDAFAKRQKP